MKSHSSKMIEEFDGSKKNNKFLYFLIFLVLITCGFLFQTFRDVPQDQLKRAIGIKNRLDEISYNAVPPNIQNEPLSKDSNELSRAKKDFNDKKITKKNYILSLEIELKEKNSKIEELQKHIKNLKKKNEKQKILLKKILE